MAGGPNPLESSGPNLWAVAAHNEIPDQAWEYHARKAANDGKGDSAYNSLEYVPCCPHMPNCVPVCTEPVFHWVKKGHAAAQIPK
ncbi:hypothetical protein PPROV_000017700 [Pycnococcus provasolii]|uniref:Uncharacterized protein n=2 Tax=Pycnococcus provasolii TaxID=41880 RepID=A0A830H6U3_9CHLO|nr:hypothetical protein PPROV_000017700 [Pycnococcus provasolii]|mmetsp:Transcript_11767/g.26407  ORF Transcript_11767/g.26407 Transcript_11767/m.26407 type:complete len:85 (-) Transcript_11767:120-374(-)